MRILFGTIGLAIEEGYDREFDYLALNVNNNMLSSKEVRMALNYAINKEEIINNIYGGKYKAADFPLEYGSYLYIKNETNYEYNIDKAKQILQMNGWEYKGGTWNKKENYNTIILKIDLVVNSENEARMNVADIIKKNLEELGIKVNIVGAKGKSYENYLKNKNYDMLLTGVTVGVSPDLTRYFGEGNYANLKNEEAKEILRELYSISDEKTLKEKYEKLQEIYEDERAYIGLYFNTIRLVHTKNLDVGSGTNWFNMFYNIENWHRK